MNGEEIRQEKLKDFYGKTYDIWDESPFNGYKEFLMNSWQVEKDEGQKKNNPDKQRRGTEITGFFERYRDEFFGLC